MSTFPCAVSIAPSVTAPRVAARACPRVTSRAQRARLAALSRRARVLSHCSGAGLCR